ncbi:hypothetical protein C3L33_22282, partial [Rhododendron williamsianum]
MQGVRRFRPLSDGGVRLELSTTTASPLAIDPTSCCMCHVMKRLLSTIGVHPTVIELDDNEIPALPSSSADGDSSSAGAPAVFIGGSRVGGLENLVALHLTGHLRAKLVEAGALEGGGTVS